MLRRLLLSTAGLALAAPLATADNITGQVTGPGGGGVPNVNITAFDQATGNEVTVANGGTNSGGFFDATLPGPGVYRVRFEPPPPPTTTLWQQDVENVVVVGTKDMGVISLPQGAALSGRVLRPNGTPYDGLDLDLVDGVTGVDYEVSGDTTDALGNFLIPAPLGPVELEFEPDPTLVPLVAPDKRVLDLVGDTDLGDVQLELGYRVDLELRGPGNVPVVNADLDAVDVATGEKRHTPGDNTDSLGKVRLILPAGTYDLEICPKLADRLVSQVLTGIVISADTNVGVTNLVSGFILSGSIQDAQGNPLAKADVDAFDEGTMTEVPLCGERTNDAGAYKTVVPAGTLTLVYQGPEGSAFCDEVFTGVVISSDTVKNAVLDVCGGNGTVYCDANPNNAADIAISTVDSANPSIVVSLSAGTPNQFVYLLVGNGSNTVSQPPGAKGDLCVVGGNCLGRYDKDVGQISAGGAFSLDIKNTVSNPCAGAVNIDPGATWNFQFWHRQPMGQPATFSKALSVTFQ